MPANRSAAGTAKKRLFVGMLLVFVGTALAIFAKFLAAPDFIPSAKLSWLSLAISPIFAATFFFVVANAKLRTLRADFSAGAKSGMRSLFALVASPLMGILWWHMFVIGPVSYVLHRLEGPVPEVRAEHVIRTSSGGRICRQSATLQGSTLFFPRQVCRLALSETELLRHGGEIVLYGDASSYGFSYTGYSVVSAER